jgi:hypothetical protein
VLIVLHEVTDNGCRPPDGGISDIDCDVFAPHDE